jgi:hypothetical protein
VSSKHNSYKQQFIVPPSFGGEDFQNFSQSETRIDHGDNVFGPIGMKSGIL